ncbi:T9SS type A sorting domain-containing protein [Flavobacterium suzhouense]|uniref:Choice-of-anchor J domain-containing protein n=1 Tax=Flavobacterium suzhouense TaxID=1529638 RepID=A0ABW5NVR3_9FLAO
MRKKLLTGAMLLGSFLAANAQQTLFEENWDGIGPGVGGWTLYNLDAKTPDADPLSSLVTDAWNVLSLVDIQTALDIPDYAYPEAATGMADNVIASNSYYSPVGTANDWLVTPAISIPSDATTVSLTFAANSMGNATYLEDYEVNISTTTNEVASFNQLLDVPNESNEGNFRTVSLNSYAGQTIYIAFRNKGNDQYVMLLDNIKVVSDGVAGLSDNFASKLSVYPNPADNILNVSNNENILISNISIADLNGRTVKSVSFDGVSNASVNIADLASGMYMMNITSDKGMTTKKIMKN